MPARRTRRTRQNGKGIGSFFKNLGNKIKDGLVTAHDYVKDKQIISNVLNTAGALASMVPGKGQAIGTAMGTAGGLAGSFGYGRRRRRGVRTGGRKKVIVT